MLRGGVIIATIAIGAAWALARVNPETDPVLAWGDWPRIHPEMLGMKAGGDSGRGSGMAADLQQTNTKQQTTSLRTWDGG